MIAIESESTLWLLILRSRPPFTGVLWGLGLKVPHRVLFEQFWAPASEYPKSAFECFLAFFGPKKGQKCEMAQKM